MPESRHCDGDLVPATHAGIETKARKYLRHLRVDFQMRTSKWCTLWVAASIVLSCLARESAELGWGFDDILSRKDVKSIFISPSGSDTIGSGNSTSPFLSIQLGVAASEKYRNAPTFILLRQGVYTLTAPIIFSVIKRATCCPLTLAAFPGENVTITCATKIPQSSWRRIKKDSSVNSAIDAGKLRTLQV